MQRLKVFSSVTAVMALLVPFVAAGTETKGPFICDTSVNEVFWLSYPGACFELKAGCKGSAAGASVFFERDWDTFSVYTDGPPSCSIESEEDNQEVNGLKGECSLQDGQFKLELKRNDGLCPYTCQKPDKIVGCP